ncbi:MAG: hypothetical protein H7Y14_02785 [Burkholderiales bacterium]|nr:hypothetical protein [Burkholderiales bacterium]
MRAVIFFVALTVMIAATFQDAAAILSRWGRPELVYIPAAIVAAALMAHARVASRLALNVGWYLVLAILALVFIAAPWAPVPFIDVVARPLLMVAIVLVLLRLTPRAGSLYERTSVPSVLVFLAFTALLYESIPIVDNIRAFGLSHPSIEKIPAPMANVAAAAIVVAIFIVASGIRHRFLQTNPTRGWLWAGLALWIAAAGASHVRAYAMYAEYVLTAAHVLLFVGAFYLLSHLLPRRGADEASFNP